MMIDNFEVFIEYKNKDLETVNTRKYTLPNYLSSMSNDIKRVLMDLEEYLNNTYGEKDQWPDEAKTMFKKIRNKLLNSSNALVRLPQVLYYNGQPCNAATMADLFDK